MPPFDPDIVVLREVTLEISLRPFALDGFVNPAAVARCMLAQWQPLIERAATISVLFWTSDGSQILDYCGDMDEPSEWAYWFGAANPREAINHDPQRLCLHATPRPYRDPVPTLTYAQLRQVVAVTREVLSQGTGKPVRMGATFDPGGEFAKSSFKYERHHEICLADTMGRGSFVCCYAKLNADSRRYAGFPNGIPPGLSLGRFLGRQARHFLRDMGFDYLWFSNGFGFGMESWKQTGPLYDGQRFDLARAPDIRRNILGFWRDFRAECDAPIAVRGTNLGTGADRATDALPLRDIYEGGFDITTPPNSPWAAINGDFGIEMVGYLSRIAHTATPDGRFPFRFYAHDPWWLNNPWLDRYQRQPHDIYLPLAVSRLDAQGTVHSADAAAILTIDDSLGHMPDVVPREVLAHLLRALDEGPDSPGPVVWVYPFDELHEDVFGPKPWPQRAFFNDWFVSHDINRGLPLNTVVSTRNLTKMPGPWPALSQPSVLLWPVPDADSPLATRPLEWVERGINVLLYGSVARASEQLLAALGLRLVEPLEGQFTLDRDGEFDAVDSSSRQTTLLHRGLVSAGGLEAELDSERAGASVITARQDRHRRALAVIQPASGTRGTLAWVRGNNTGGLSASETLDGAMLLRYALAFCGLDLRFSKRRDDQRHPVTAIHHHRGAMWFSGYLPDTTVEWQCRMADGAALLTNRETELRAGRSCYRFGRAWRHECRVWISQPDGWLSCHEYVTPQPGITRRLKISGLNGAVLVFAAEPGMPPVFRFNSPWPHVEDQPLRAVPLDTPGHRWRLHDLTGDLIISW